jgi:hypothetical protein
MRHLVTAALVALAAPSVVSAQTAISPGDTIQGRFSNQDPTLTDDSHFRCYRLQTRAGQRYVVDLRSGDFDAYLAVGAAGDCATMAIETSDDDGGGGTNSRIAFDGDGRARLVRANTLSAGETGAFSLTVAATESGPATAVARSVSVGQTVRAELSQSDTRAHDDSFFDCYRLALGSGQGAAVTMTASFDTYLAAYAGGDCSGATIQTNDDDEVAGGTNSRIVLSGLPSGAYSVRANSLGANVTGAYTFAVAGIAAAPARSRWADWTIESQACLYRPGSARIVEGVGKRDSEGYVLLSDGRETTLEAFGYTEGRTREWLISNAPVRLGGRTFVKYGLPRILGFDEVVYFAEHDGVLFAAEPGSARPEVVYALVQGVGCEFQPYQVQD